MRCTNGAWQILESFLRISIAVAGGNKMREGSLSASVGVEATGVTGHHASSLRLNPLIVFLLHLMLDFKTGEI